MPIYQYLCYLSGSLWCLIAIVPFILRFHYVPLPQWTSEACAGSLVILAWFFLCINRSLAPYLPRVSWWMLGLAFVWWLQSMCLPLLFPGLNWAVSLSFVAMALLAYVTFSLKKELGVEKLTLWLAWALLAGALLQSIIGFCQVSGFVRYMSGVLFYDSQHTTTNVFGHIGQRNQYAHYLSWGIVSLGYLYARRYILTWLAVPLILWLAVSLGWSASRMTILYAGAMFCIAACWFFRLRTTDSLRLWGIFSGIALAIVIVQFQIDHLNALFHLQASPSGVERLAASVIADTANSGDRLDRRSVEWQKARLVFQANPWFGVGWSQFGYQSLALQVRPEFANAAFNSALFANSHNLVMQLLAETGVIGTLVVVMGFLWIVVSFMVKPARFESVLPLCLIAITLLHSLVEYPLWYLYFLAVFVMCLSLLPADKEPEVEHSLISNLCRMATAVFVVILSVLLINGKYTYNELVNLYSPSKTNTVLNRRNIARLEQIIETKPMYAFHALNALQNYIDPDEHKDLARKLYWVNRLAAFRPYSTVMINKSKLEALSGDQDKAQETLRLALATYPTYAKIYMSELSSSEPAYETLYQIAAKAYEGLPTRYKTQN